VTLGEGYAGAAIAGGCVYVLDYDEGAAADTLRCLSLDDGREVWRNSYPVQLTRNHGMSRTVPAVVGDNVITMGPRCHVACWDARTGQCRWLIDLVRDHQATVPRWYSGQCPLVDQGRVILAPCGSALLIAVDLHTGDVIWESPNPRNWQMTHASIMPMQYEGQQTYLVCGSGGVAAIAADDGSIQWDSTEWPTTFATCPSPLVLPEGQVFLCSGYGRTVGSLLLEVHTTEDGRLAKPLLKLAPQQFNAEHQTPIFYGGHIYGVRKRGGGQLVCLDLQGRELWNSGADRFGHGPYMIADELLFVMDDHGELAMAEATPDAYQRLGRFAVFPDGHDAWGPMALADGRLIVRDMTRMACLDIAER
jgi:outer membrane protein assembly factor BamB